jgi:peptide-methionine (S)-S-oxide reductase
VCEVHDGPQSLFDPCGGADRRAGARARGRAAAGAAVVSAPRLRRWLGAAAVLVGAAAALPAQERAPERAGTSGPGGPAVAVFASGCFWCSEADFAKVRGVVDVESGYTGGAGAGPTYEQVSAGGTGHLEAVRVRYDPARVSYAQLLDVFWHNVDPVDARGQFCDKGEQYTGAIFVATPAERALAEASWRRVGERLAPRGEPVATRILPAAPFYPAEAYHQDYARKNPVRYRFYRTTCGRDARLRELRQVLDAAR